MNIRLYDCVIPLEPDFKFSNVEPWYIDFRKGASYYQLAMIKDKSTNLYKLGLRFYRADKRPETTDTVVKSVENDCKPGSGNWWETARILSAYQKGIHTSRIVCEDFFVRSMDRLNHGYIAKTARIPDLTTIKYMIPDTIIDDVYRGHIERIKESCKLHLNEISSSNS